MPDSLLKEGAVPWKNWAKLLQLHIRFHIFTSLFWHHGVSNVVVNIIAAGSPVFDLCTHCIWPLHDFWPRWLLPPPPTSFIIDFQETTLSGFHLISLFKSFFCGNLLITITSYILTTPELFHQISFLSTSTFYSFYAISVVISSFKVKVTLM